MTEPPNVLVVDDDADLAWITAEILAATGWRVRLAADGEEGLSMLRPTLPDAVILDVEMPILDGPAVAARMIVEDLGLEKIPIVLVSGVVDLEEVAREVGTPYFVYKPFDIDKLVDVVRLALEERQPPKPTRPSSQSSDELAPAATP
jgi:DNA-binding NtrC family response regulator